MITFEQTAPPPPAQSAVAAVAPSDTASAAQSATIAIAAPSGSVSFGTLGVLGGIDASASDVFGAGGLGLSGLGDGGRSEGISIGTLGRGGLGAGTRLRQGTTTIIGRLPPEVIQRIVRQNFGRFRACYERGLARDPTLSGTVATKFVIDTKGAVTSLSRDPSTTLADAEVVACVSRGFSNLSFPAPEGGVVSVIYPLVFAP